MILGKIMPLFVLLKNILSTNTTTTNRKTLFYYSAYVTKDDPRNEARINFKIWAQNQEQALDFSNAMLIKYLPMIVLHSACISDTDSVDIGMRLFDENAIVLDTDMNDKTLISKIEKFKKYYKKYRGWDLA